MAELSPAQYDQLELAIQRGQRIAIYRRGTEYLVIPVRLDASGRREALEAVHPTTGEQITLYLDELDSLEVVR